MKERINRGQTHELLEVVVVDQAQFGQKGSDIAILRIDPKDVDPFNNDMPKIPMEQPVQAERKGEQRSPGEEFEDGNDHYAVVALARFQWWSTWRGSVRLL
jgi:hypothetical protein